MSRSTMRTVINVSLLTSLCLVGFSANALAQSGAHERSIAEAYTAWVEAANAKDIEAWASYLAPDAAFFPPGRPMLADRAAILDFYSELFADSQFSLQCRVEGVEVATGEDMAWAHGYCESSYTGTDGRLAHGSTKWVKVWKRQPNGEWKCAVNTWNAIGPS